MSFYNMVNGVNQAVFYVLPMLGKHPDEYPRFRDCFVRDEEHPEYDNHIHIYTRVGGNNRDDYEAEIEEMREHPDFVADFDDSYDCTYASYVFRVPERWRADFDRLMATGDLRELSDEYKAELRRVYPKLKEKFDAMFAVNTDTAPPS